MTYLLTYLLTVQTFAENPSCRHWRCCAHWRWCGICDDTIWWSWTFARWHSKFVCKSNCSLLCVAYLCLSVSLQN